MASRVLFHVGLPKTGTTYLQTILWNNTDELRRQGVLLPGESSRQHLWASGAVREDPRLERRGAEAPYARKRLTDEITEWAGTAVVSQEFFARASANEWNGGTMDLADVLRRWGASLPHERLPVLVVPKPSEPSETLWLRFADL